MFKTQIETSKDIMIYFLITNVLQLAQGQSIYYRSYFPWRHMLSLMFLSSMLNLIIPGRFMFYLNYQLSLSIIQYQYNIPTVLTKDWAIGQVN